MSLKGRRVLITGGASGIGRAIADELARQGALLAIAGRRPNRLERAASEIARSCPKIERPRVWCCDVTDRAEVRGLVEGCAAALSGIDVLVNNAGISVYGDTERTTVADFRSVLETNFFGALNCMIEVLPVMKRQGSGIIVNILSVAALHGVPYLAAYSASKAALAAASQSLRAELHDSGISVMLVYPGYTETDLFQAEKAVGGARRPPRPYAPAARVAEDIVKALRNGKHDLVFTLEGKALNLLEGFIPITTEKVMIRMADRLRNSGGDNEQT